MCARTCKRERERELLFLTKTIHKDSWIMQVLYSFVKLITKFMSSSIVFGFQIEKIVLFLLEKQGLLAARLSDLGEQHHALTQQSDGSSISELKEAYRAVGQELLRLLFFVEMNAIGIRKILKKFDKRFGCKFTDYYVKTRANHPYSQLRQVFKHVVSWPI